MPAIKSSKYVQKYVKSWECLPQFKEWLQPLSGSNTRAFCALCKEDLSAHKKTLEDHCSKNKKHLAIVAKKRGSVKIPKITNFISKSISKQRKKSELKIAAFVAKHCATAAVDDLGDVISGLDPSSETLSQIRLHRTKCTGLILNIIAPCLLEELIEDIGDSKYSLIADESTMVDNKKVMCVMIRYFSQKQKKVRTTFYSIIELESGTADSMTTSLKNQIEKDKLKLQNLIGIGVDGANAMVGVNNSVSSILKNEIPHLVTVKCLCHSLHLCAELACDVLPKHLDFLVKQSHSWFSRSTKRNIEYQKLFEVMCEPMPNKIPKLSGTRWLARLKAIEEILSQWDQLLLHFDLMRASERGDSGYKAEMLYQMYQDKTNKLYLLFLKNALKNVIKVNSLFQSESVEPLKLLKDLNDLIESTLQKIVVPQQLKKINRNSFCEYPFHDNLMRVDCIDYGYDFNEFSRHFDPNTLFSIKQRCRDFLIKLAKELQKRISGNSFTLEKMSMLTPQIASARIKPDIRDLAVEFKNVCLDVDETVNEWNLLHRLEIKNIQSSDGFWAEVLDEVDARGNPRYKHICKLAIALLALPFSNASVERAFSVANIVKNKLRNRMSIITLDAIMRIRFYLVGKTSDFNPSAKMLELFVSENVYQSDFVDEVLDEVCQNLV